MNRENEVYVSWSNTYSTGVSFIDDQHKGILKLVNDLLNMKSENDAGQDIYSRQIIHQVLQYVKTHFATEESLLVAIGFPGYIIHKKFHDEFILTAAEGMKDPEKFTYFLKDWVLSHIAVMDRNYSSYFQATADEKTPVIAKA